MLQDQKNNLDKSRQLNHVAMEAFFNLMNKWQINSANDKIKILGSPSQSSFFNWQKGLVRNVPHDTIIRISYLLGIHKALKMLFSGNNERAYAWIKKPNKAFGGNSAYDRIMAGEIVDLAYVRNYLDSMRGM